ncbi:MAG: hypothetical protein HOY79_32940 [Streptomyces sp.]|nr:hypothetical protein [Streptomyces sp.]
MSGEAFQRPQVHALITGAYVFMTSENSAPTAKKQRRTRRTRPHRPAKSRKATPSA